MRGDCVFCKIARGEIVAHRVHEDELALAFMDVGQVNPGHVIVAVKPHLKTIADLTPEQVGATFHTVNRIARAVSAAFKSEGLTILQPNGIAGGQTVPHFHLHVLPRHTNDGVHVTWHRKNPPPDELAKLAARIRKKRPVRSSIPREKEEAMRRCVIVVVVLVLVPSVSSAVEFTARTNLFLDNTAGPCAGASVAGPAATPVAVERVCGPFGGQVVLDASRVEGASARTHPPSRPALRPWAVAPPQASRKRSSSRARSP